VIAGLPNTENTSSILAKSSCLKNSFKQYLNFEFDKARIWRNNFHKNEKLVIYGFGDNFFRSTIPNGPLDGLNIEVVVDKDWRRLSQSNYSRVFTFINLEEAIKKYSSRKFVVSISWGSEEIISYLNEKGVKKIVLL